MDRSPARAALVAERARDLFGARGPSAYASVALVVFLVLETAGLAAWASPRPAIFVWVVLALLTQAASATLIFLFFRRHRSDAELAAWARAKAAIELLHGLAWGSAAALVHAPGQMVTLLVVVGTLMAFTAAMSASLAVHMLSLIAFAVSALVLGGALLLLRGVTVPEAYAAYMLVSCAALVVANAARMSLFYDEGIRLRLALRHQRDEGRRLQVEAEAGRRAAEQAGAERTRFFGAASHDLRQPVHALGLYAALLRSARSRPEQRRLAASIASCVNTLERLFDSILSVAQAGRGGEPVASQSLQSLLTEVLLQNQPEAERRGLRLRTCATSIWVAAPAGVLERILGNLVSNALRYTPSGEVLIGGRRRGEQVALVVADTGIGFSRADADRIFEPFFQVHDHGRTGREGFGLGLATVQELCIAHGYEIVAHSVAGRGSRFEVIVPRASPPRSVILAPAEDPTAGRRVIVLEDDSLAADALCALLRRWGMSATHVEDGDGALQALGTGDAEACLVLLDQRLAGTETGLDVARRIRRKFGPGVRMALLTGEADVALFQAARRKGLEVLHKPLKPIRLRAFLAASEGPTATAATATATD